MYPKKQAKSDRERFLDAFKRKVGTSPDQYLNRKLSSGMAPTELQPLYDQLAVEIAMKAHCTALRYTDVLNGEKKTENRAEYHRQRAGSQKIPTCARCGAQMVLRTGVSGPRKGQKYWAYVRREER